MTTTVTMGVFTPSVLLRVARGAGVLAQQDIAVKEVPVPASPAQFRALLDGDLDVVLTNPDNTVAYRFCPDNPLGETGDVKVISGIDRGLGLGLYARESMSLGQLRDATWAVDVRESGFAFILYAVAEFLGLPYGEYPVVALGSTPRRLDALIAGRCDVTMLNAGNDLLAEAAGCQRLAGVHDVCRPYLGTVLAVCGEANLDVGRRAARALRRTTDLVLAGIVDDLAVAEAQAALGLDRPLAERYVARLKDPANGLVPGGAVGTAELGAVIELRKRYRPVPAGVTDPLDAAHVAGSGLLAP